MFFIAYAERMAEQSKKNPVDLPTGRTVAENIKRLRGDMQYTKLAELLEKLGRPIPTLGLRHIEACKRRVDADDLVALAVALGVTPITLLMPYTQAPDDQAAITGLVGSIPSEALWGWLTAERSISISLGELVEFYKRALPPWAWAERQDKVSAMVDEMISDVHPRVRAILRNEDHHRGDDQ